MYWNFVYQPLHMANGRIKGVIVMATEGSEQVQARRVLEQLNHDLLVTNQ